MESDFADAGEKYGQKVDLTQRIKGILSDYPEGCTLMKEMLQNADDAGATKVFFCLDLREHGISAVPETMQEFQGPALLVFNDAEFTDSDFEGICNIDLSSKRAETTKAGRFGIGFNSVYHITDLPSLVSTKYVAVLDPHTDIVPGADAANPGRRYNFVDKPLLQKYPDLFVPYKAFGCSMEHRFKGTLFRFPLRTLTRAKKSRLSCSPYCREDILQMFEDFKNQAPLCLLFLKSLELVDLMIWERNESEPCTTFTCHVSSLSSKAREEREHFIKRSSPLMTPSSSSFQLAIETQSWEPSSGELAHSRTEEFLVCLRMDGTKGEAGRRAVQARLDLDVHLVPFVSVATCISVQEDTCAQGPPEETGTSGRAFSFLPLPLFTGLPVHVNGYFELSSNRRGLWGGQDLQRQGRFKAEWNESLLADVAPHAYCDLLLRASRLLGPQCAYYGLFPRQGVEQPWAGLVAGFYRIAMGEPLLYEPSVGELALHAAPGTSGKWVNLGGGVVLRNERYRNPEALQLALLKQQLHVVYGPPALHAAGILLLATPALVRAALKKQHAVCGKKADKLVLLEFCLSDAKENNFDLKALHGLPLIPLLDESFGSLSSAITGSEIVVPRSPHARHLEHNLLAFAHLGGSTASLEDLLLAGDALGVLQNFARQRKGSLRLLDCGVLAQLLKRTVFQSTRTLEAENLGVCCEWEAWVSDLWSFIQKCSSKELDKFEDLPILPTVEGFLRPLSPTPTVLCPGFPEPVREVLVSLGCCTLRTDLGIATAHLKAWVVDPTPVGAWLAVKNVAAQVGVQPCHLPWSSLPPDQLRSMRMYLLQAVDSWPHPPTIHDVQALPLFEVYVSAAAPATLAAPPLGTQFVPLSPRQTYFLPPEIADPHFFDSSMVRPASAVESQALILGKSVVQLSEVRFVRDKVLPSLWKLAEEEREELMLQVIRNRVYMEDQALKEILAGMSFVPTESPANVPGSRKRKRPSDLYDPRSCMRSLLQADDFFPTGDFEADDILDVLLSLGLKRSLPSSVILNVAREIASGAAAAPEDAAARGEMLLQCLELQVDDVCSGCLNSSAPGAFWRKLSILAWCPVLQEPPEPSGLLPWPTEPSPSTPLPPVAAPSTMRPLKDMWLCSGTKRILSRDVTSPILCASLGWSSTLGDSALAQQLQELGQRAMKRGGGHDAGSFDGMSSLVAEIRSRAERNEYFRLMFSELRFVPSCKSRLSHALKTPGELCDPRNKDLTSLLGPDTHMLPLPGVLCQPGMLDLLVLLGLQQAITKPVLLSIARELEQDAARSSRGVEARSQYLLQYLDEHVASLTQPASTAAAGARSGAGAGDHFWEELQGIAWCPVLRNPPVQSTFLPWPREHHTRLTAPPRTSRLPSDIWHCSGALSIVRSQRCASRQLADVLGWSRPIPLRIVVWQWAIIVMMFLLQPWGEFRGALPVPLLQVENAGDPE